MAGQIITYTEVPQNSFETVNLPRPAFGVLIQNMGNVSVSLKNDGGRDVDDCPPGLTLGWNHPEGLYAPAVGCVGFYQGVARVYFYDGPLDLTGNPPAQQPPPNVPFPVTGIGGAPVTVTGALTITAGTVNLGNAVSIAANQSVNIGTIAGTVGITGAVTITSGSVTIGNAISIAAGQSVNIGTVAGTVGITGSVSITGSVTVGNAISIAAGQSVNVGAVLSAVTITGSVSITGSVTVGNAISIAAGQSVNIGTVASTVGVTGSVSITGNVNIGNAISIASGQSINVGTIATNVTITGTVTDLIVENNTTATAGILANTLVSLHCTPNVVQSLQFAKAVQGFSLQIAQVPDGFLDVYYYASGTTIYLTQKYPFHILMNNTWSLLEKAFDADIPSGASLFIQFSQTTVATDVVVKY